MVKVEPFVYQKITAFKERVQMVNKINEIVESLNGVFDEAQVKEYVTNELLNYYTKEEVDTAIAEIDLSPYATMVYVDNKSNEDREYTDSKFEVLDNAKQNKLTAITPLAIDEFNNLSLNGYKLVESIDWTPYGNQPSGGVTRTEVYKDCCFVLVNGGQAIPFYLMKGIYPTWFSNGFLFLNFYKYSGQTINFPEINQVSSGSNIFSNNERIGIKRNHYACYKVKGTDYIRIVTETTGDNLTKRITMGSSEGIYLFVRD